MIELRVKCTCRRYKTVLVSDTSVFEQGPVDPWELLDWMAGNCDNCGAKMLFDRQAVALRHFPFLPGSMTAEYVT